MAAVTPFLAKFGYYAAKIPSGTLLPDIAGVSGVDYPAVGAQTGWDTYTPPTGVVSVPSAAPVLSRVTPDAGPDDVVWASGDQFSSGVYFQIYGQTGANDGRLESTKSKPMYTVGNVSCTYLPASLPKNGMYMVWPVIDGIGVGVPLCVGRTEAWWLQSFASDGSATGDTHVVPGNTVNVYGINLSNGAGKTWLYVVPTGTLTGGQILSIASGDVTNVNDKRVQFTMPTTINSLGAAGNDYDVWVSNGHGDWRSWSKCPVVLQCRSATAAFLNFGGQVRNLSGWVSGYPSAASTTSVSYGTGNKTWTIPAGLTSSTAWQDADTVYAIDKNNPGSYMKGTINASGYNNSTGALSVNVTTSHQGSAGASNALWDLTPDLNTGIVAALAFSGSNDSTLNLGNGTYYHGSVGLVGSGGHSVSLQGTGAGNTTLRPLPDAVQPWIDDTGGNYSQLKNLTYDDSVYWTPVLASDDAISLRLTRAIGCNLHILKSNHLLYGSNAPLCLTGCTITGSAVYGVRGFSKGFVDNCAFVESIYGGLSEAAVYLLFPAGFAMSNSTFTNLDNTATIYPKRAWGRVIFCGGSSKNIYLDALTSTKYADGSDQGYAKGEQILFHVNGDSTNAEGFGTAGCTQDTNGGFTRITYPHGSTFTHSIASVTGNGVSPIVITTSVAHNFSSLETTNTVDIAGVLGNTAANGVGLPITVLSPTTFSIPGTGNGAYISGGTWTFTNAVGTSGFVVVSSGKGILQSGRITSTASGSVTLDVLWPVTINAASVVNICDGTSRVGARNLTLNGNNNPTTTNLSTNSASTGLNFGMAGADVYFDTLAISDCPHGLTFFSVGSYFLLGLLADNIDPCVVNCVFKNVTITHCPESFLFGGTGAGEDASLVLRNVTSRFAGAGALNHIDYNGQLHSLIAFDKCDLQDCPVGVDTQFPFSYAATLVLYKTHLVPGAATPGKGVNTNAQTLLFKTIDNAAISGFLAPNVP